MQIGNETTIRFTLGRVALGPSFLNLDCGTHPPWALAQVILTTTLERLIIVFIDVLFFIVWFNLM